MSPSELSNVYKAAQRVYKEEIDAKIETAQLAKDHGINEASASYGIRVFRHLMRGEVFKRGLSSPDMDLFLSRIQGDYGPVQLRIALNALWLHIGYYEAKKKTNLHRLRAVAATHQAKSAPEESLEAVESAFQAAVSQSMNDSAATRDSRLQSAQKVPHRKLVTVLAFERNPDVVAAVLLRAAGTCERCRQPAPFRRRKDETPYLEVHHKKRLADNGEDTVANAEALCPNCHRNLHYGTNAASQETPRKCLLCGSTAEAQGQVSHLP